MKARVLKKVVEWCRHHVNDPFPTGDIDDIDSYNKTTEIDEWDKDFMGGEQVFIFDIILVGLPFDKTGPRLMTIAI